MLREMAPERATATAPDDRPAATGLVVAAAAVRGAVVAVAGVLLTAGLALMVWAITPASGPDPAVAMRGGVTAFALANLMPVEIGDVQLSLPPLLLTALPVTLLALTARRGRFLPTGRYQESVAVLTTTGVYGLVVAATTRGYSTPGAVPAGWVWTAFALALVATALGMLRGDSAWSQWLRRALPGWARSGVRGALVGTGALIGAGAMVLSCGLILRFGAAVDIAAAAAPSWLDGLGMALLGLAYLPNAVVAAVGFVSGVGFEFGPGTYSPLGTSTVDLPGVPLLAAAPQHDGRTLLGLACMVLPFAVGYLVARPVVRRLVTRADRVAAAALAGVLTGTLLAATALVAGGGVGDGRWSTMGVPAWLLGPAIAVEVGAVACVIAAASGWRTVPWRVRDIAAESDTESDAASSRRRRRPGKAAEKSAPAIGDRRGRVRARRGRAGRRRPRSGGDGDAVSESTASAGDSAEPSAADVLVDKPVATGGEAADGTDGDGATVKDLPVEHPEPGLAAPPTGEPADEGKRGTRQREQTAGRAHPESGDAVGRTDD